MNKIYDFPIKYDFQNNILQFQPICLEDIVSIGIIEKNMVSLFCSGGVNYVSFTVFSKYSCFKIAYDGTSLDMPQETTDALCREREKLVLAWKEFKEC
jgi:hypothetical protein